MISDYNQYNSINIIYDEISNEKVDLNIPILHKDENPSPSKNKSNEEDNKQNKTMQEIEQIKNENEQINMDQMPPDDYKDPELDKLFEGLNESYSKLDNGNVKKSENIDERKKIVNYNGLGWNELDELQAQILEEDFMDKRENDKQKLIDKIIVMEIMHSKNIYEGYWEINSKTELVRQTQKVNNFQIFIKILILKDRCILKN